MDTMYENAQTCFVKQPDETFCGVASLASIIRFYGQTVDLTRLRTLSETTRRGTTLLGLHKAAETVGLNVGAYKADLKNLQTLGEPCILHVENGKGRQRFVVCYGYEEGRFIVGDPAIGVRSYRPKKLRKIWTSRALLTLRPGKDFADMATRQNAATPDLSGRFRCFDVTATPFGHQHMLLRSGTTGQTKILPAPVAQSVLSLDRFDTLDHHAAFLAEQLTQASSASPSWPAGPSPTSSQQNGHPPDVDAIKRDLTALIEDGILVGEETIRAKILDLCEAEPAFTPAATTITTLGIPTRNRPECLHRALDSYIANTQRHGRTASFVVADDSDEARIRKRNHQALADLRDRYDADLRYIDRHRKERFASLLAQHADVAPSVVRFALLGDERCTTTYGANRNALLLDASGEVCLQVDDDTICELRAASDGRSGLALTSVHDPYEYWFYDHRAAALDGLPKTDADFLGLHERLLGKPLAASLHDIDAKQLRFDDIDADFLRQAHHPKARIALTFAGSVGDSGMSNQIMRMFLKGDSFARLVASETSYRNVFTMRQLLRMPSRSSIGNGLFCMTMNVGLDNRTLLPPFMPNGRNEDGLFSLVLKLCTPHAFRGFLSEVVLQHDPPEDRTPIRDIHVPPMNTNDVLLRVMASFEGWPGDGVVLRMRALGRYLMAIGSLSRQAYTDRLRAICEAAVGTQMAHLQRLLAQRPDAPEYWVKDVRTYLTSVQETVTQEDFFIPEDLCGSPEERLTLLQELTHQYGELLLHWPEIAEGANDLRQRGQRLATRVSS